MDFGRKLVFPLREKNEISSCKGVNSLTRLRAEVELSIALKLRFNLEMAIREFRGRRLKYRDKGGLAFVLHVSGLSGIMVQVSGMNQSLDTA